MPNRLKPKSAWTRKTRLAASKKRLSTKTPLRSRSPKSKTSSKSKPFSRRNELIAPHQDLKDRLSRLTAKIITFGVKNCPTCRNRRRGSGWNITNSHVRPRRVDATAFDIFLGGNCVPQCLNCNQNHTQKDDQPLLVWFRKTYGVASLALVESRWNRAKKVDVVELSARVVLYQEILELITVGEITRADLIVDVEKGTVRLPARYERKGIACD